MISPVLLLLTGIAAATDLWRHKIYNWLTYPGILAGLFLNTWETGWDGFQHGVSGLALCGGLMVVCFVLFQIGGGDVKLLAMIGAFLGPHKSLEVLLWTFVLGAIVGVGLLIWRLGFVCVVRSVARHLACTLRLGRWMPLSDEERRQLQPPLYLAPAAAVAVVLVVSGWSDRLAG